MIELEVEYIHETADAVLVEDGLVGEIWIPKSVLEDFQDDTHNRHDPIEIYVPEWYAKKKGMI